MIMIQKFDTLPQRGLSALAAGLLCAMGASAAVPSQDGIVALYPMDVQNGQITEKISGHRYGVQGHFAPENLPGAVGQALRFDGYTSYIEASIGDVLPAGSKDMTVSVWLALPCYPIVKIDEQTAEKVAVLSCLDETKKTGFGFFLGLDGKYSFRTYVGGWALDINVDTPLPVYQWNNLVATIDSSTRKAKLYLNGQEVGSSNCNGAPSLAAATLRFGHGTTDNFSGPFRLNAFNGLIDELAVYSRAIPQSEIQGWTAENPADLDIPASRFANDILRPRFHGMPAAAWTNECHGMWYADGRYHLFFQKNADGPYMARLHWGHITSANLYDWTEEPIAIAPGEWYDLKGCWSGCVFSDQEITGGKPNIIYTGVDYARAMISQATPLDSELIKWHKLSSNPIIDGRPGGLSDDFRDPYFFRNGSNAYIIVGSSKNGVGTTTLHRYDPSTKKWSNNGDLFFTGASAAQDGTFWEMPNVTKMPDGKWLFTATPLNTSTGVRTIYYTGSIADNGTFQPSSKIPKNVELNSRDGFGLLSPTIYQHDGKTIAIGIVPDKLSAQDNWNLGWAHCYSLPREWSLDTQGNLLQKPFEGLQGMRAAGGYTNENFVLNGTQSLAPVSGRAVELLGEFKVGSTPFGFRFFKNSKAEATLTYTPTTGEMVVDFSRLARLVNDGGVYGGVYRCSLPEFLRGGSTMKINVFIDHSILDIFINDKWATSIRVFPTDTDANGIEAFAGGDVQVQSLRAWTLQGGNTGIGEISADPFDEADAPVYTLDGLQVADPSNLSSGIYLRAGRKFIVK